MAELIIHRCTLRLVRRQGWSWGPEPQRLLKTAVAALPLLIARKLVELLPDDEAEISEVRLTIPIKLSELLDLSAEASTSGETSQRKSIGALEQKVSEAIGRAFPPASPASDQETATENISKPFGALEALAPEEPSSLPPPVLRVILEWKRLGELEVHLASFTQDELGAWYLALSVTVAEMVEQIGGNGEAGSKSISQLMQRIRKAAPDRRTSLRLCISVLAEIVAQFRQRPGDENAVQEIFAKVTRSFGHATEAPDFKPNVLSEAPMLAERAGAVLEIPTSDRAPAIRRSSATVVHLRSVLPFLLLGPLSKIGYLDALAATLETIGLQGEVSMFAMALAFKVLTPPARGWRRDPEDSLAAAAFAGLESPPAGEAVAEFSRKISGHLTPLDSLLSYTLVKGHRPDSPVLLHRTREENSTEGWLLVEVEGFFPIAWAVDLESLQPALRYFIESYVLIHQSSAEKEAMCALDSLGCRFITDALPTRGEQWREVRRAPRIRWFSNDREAKDATILQAAESLVSSADETELLWQSLKVDRPAIPTARNSDFERSVTNAAALALGTISWELWRHREIATPILALERFGNLEGRLRFTPTAVEIRLPLGRRQRDLYEHRLLGDVHQVPWLNGRRVEFFGG